MGRLIATACFGLAASPYTSVGTTSIEPPPPSAPSRRPIRAASRKAMSVMTSLAAVQPLFGGCSGGRYPAGSQRFHHRSDVACRSAVVGQSRQEVAHRARVRQPCKHQPAPDEERDRGEPPRDQQREKGA